MIGAVGRPFDCGETRSFEPAYLGERVAFHIDHVALDCALGRRERVAGAADSGREFREDGWKFESRRHIAIERSRPQWHAEPAHIHVALDERAALEHGARRVTAAASGAEVDDVR